MNIRGVVGKNPQKRFGWAVPLAVSPLGTQVAVRRRDGDNQAALSEQLISGSGGQWL